MDTDTANDGSHAARAYQKPPSRPWLTMLLLSPVAALAGWGLIKWGSYVEPQFFGGPETWHSPAAVYIGIGLAVLGGMLLLAGLVGAAVRR